MQSFQKYIPTAPMPTANQNFDHILYTGTDNGEAACKVFEEVDELSILERSVVDSQFLDIAAFRLLKDRLFVAEPNLER